MISKTLQEALNIQVNKELYSSYLYLSMAAYFENKNLKGFAQWMYVQADEERGHGMRLFEHLIDRGAKVTLKAIDAPEQDWPSYLDLFKVVQKHEATVTSYIYKLYEMAIKENDYACQVLLQWFINEQVEEEKSAAEIEQELELIGDSGPGLLILDQKLGSRGKG